MKRTTRLTALTCLVLLVSICILTACGSKNTNGIGNVNQTTSSNYIGNVSPDGTDYNLPAKEDLSVNGDPYVYRAYVRSNYDSKNTMEDGNPAFYCEDFWVGITNDASDALEYAVYSRNHEIEETYNVKIKQVPQSGNMVAELRSFYQNGDQYDLTIILAKSAAQAATQNLLKDLKSLQHVDLTHDAFDQNSIRELSMGGKLYYLSGDMNISTMDCCSATMVNLSLYEDLTETIVEAFGGNLLWEDIYNVVKAKQWTMDNMLKIAEIATIDANTEDGALGNNSEDRIGYCQYATSTLYYFYAAGGRLTDMTEEGYPEFTVQKPANQDIFDYLYQKFNKHQTNLKIPYGWSGVINSNFIEKGNTLFAEMGFWGARKNLYMQETFPYGFLPNPLYEAGEDYHSLIYFYNTVHLWAIPSLANNDYRSQKMLQIMAAYSNVEKPGSTMDAYYLRTLYFVISGPSSGSREVMNMIKDSMVYDIAVLYNWGDWAKALERLGEQTYNEYASLISQIENKAKPQMQATIDAFRNPSDPNHFN